MVQLTDMTFGNSVYLSFNRDELQGGFKSFQTDLWWVRLIQMTAHSCRGMKFEMYICHKAKLAHVQRRKQPHPHHTCIACNIHIGLIIHSSHLLPWRPLVDSPKSVQAVIVAIQPLKHATTRVHAVQQSDQPSNYKLIQVTAHFDAWQALRETGRMTLSSKMPENVTCTYINYSDL